ncbi:MAG: hypothetical protein IBX50_12555 [Marinospirillum sp.]|uniref:hypothetical protein n=1 Tax=Marinospirillum sp. TaxID=2183934 RepID=UPI0019FEDC1A|nr:hypothetical protein [Marinospirillum sp.]MBE0507528.1 hypothetical protein [Marinospirillum sp.]
MEEKSFFSKISNPHEVITAISEAGRTFPEFMQQRVGDYKEDIKLFSELTLGCESSAELLEKIRIPKVYSKKTQMTLLKLFRRCVSPVCDTEATKKIQANPTSLFINNYGYTFKPISDLKRQFSTLSETDYSVLSALLGEYDKRGEQGYILTDIFFNWVEENLGGKVVIEGPRGAGKDIQLSDVFKDFTHDYPCDFIIKDRSTKEVKAVGFARYDSTRGGAQSDDRTGGNSDKVSKAASFCLQSGNQFKVIFLADGPGLAHGDTWAEACNLDNQWNGNVRVTTLKTAVERLTLDWLYS